MADPSPKKALPAIRCLRLREEIILAQIASEWKYLSDGGYLRVDDLELISNIDESFHISQVLLMHYIELHKGNHIEIFRHELQLHIEGLLQHKNIDFPMRILGSDNELVQVPILL